MNNKGIINGFALAVVVGAAFGLLLAGATLLFMPETSDSSTSTSAGASKPGAVEKRSLAIQQGNMKLAEYNVELAMTISQKRRGLSYREKLPVDEGMLFTVGDNDRFFHMQHMVFPIDIVFFDRNRHFVGALHSLPPCNKQRGCPLYKTPPGSAYALELNSGEAQRKGIAHKRVFFVLSES